MIACHSTNDTELFRRISIGDELAFKEYFHLHKVELFKVIIRLTKSQALTEEIIQEIFIGLWVSRQHLSKVEDPAAYLYRILLNKTATYLKKEVNQERIIRAASLLYKQPGNNNTEQAIEAKEYLQWIEKALDQLPPQQRIVYQLSRQQGLTNDEIAGQLHISPHTVRSHLAKAMGFIRTYLGDIAMVLALVAEFMHPKQ
ncbi:RNA polymerase sigma-70 factor [Paraflavitalea sp. CAU 1676]|uniref:RNA polymerase sigma factor n=1 Tax=Paraflavitalea sp. CAU 1676 TaxID=3032598 RepID=UPI0023DC84EF|nr:RNA polymerase sigma-70 factor [Paraflavitalea sp. CAU 1676]MDF2190328.1 RNA polymerase sigma-70 factor [Paraflavitalea sp. CAU 1676]